MGTNCGHKDPPDISNVCTSDQIGQGDTRNYELPHFCAPLNDFFGADSIRRDFCEAIGGGGEWGYQGEGGECSYDSTDPKSGVNFGVGCCHTHCGILGAKTICKRERYGGDNAKCCFRDLAYNGSAQYCYEANDEKLTCNPNYRDMTGTGCQTTMLDYCAGVGDNNVTMEDLIERWSETSDQSCIYAVKRNLFGNPNIPGLTSQVPINPELFNNNEGFRWSQQLFNALFNKYTELGFQIGALPGFPGYNEFQSDVIFPICSTVPGLCEVGLQSTCSSLTLEDLTNAPELVPWCGCYLNDIEYQKYVDEYQVNKECTPPCARQGNIPLANISGFGVLPCKQSICIIDNVTIALEQSQVGGSINFSQFCGACGGSAQGSATSASGRAQASESAVTCQCFINDVNIDTASSMIGGGINLNEICGTDTQCFRPNPNGDDPPIISAPCDASPIYNPNNDPVIIAEREAEETQAFRRNVIIAIVILGVIALVFIIYLLSQYGNNTDPIVIPRKPLPLEKAEIGKYSLANTNSLLTSSNIYNSHINQGPGYAGSINQMSTNNVNTNLQGPGMAGSIQHY